MQKLIAYAEKRLKMWHVEKLVKYVIVYAIVNNIVLILCFGCRCT